MTALPVARIVSRLSDPELPYPTVVINCPYCHQGHTHGAPDIHDDDRRTSHCHQGDYRISSRNPRPKGTAR